MTFSYSSTSTSTSSEVISNSKTYSTSLLDLPLELLLKIMMSLGAKDKCQFSMVSQRCQEIAYDPILWTSLTFNEKYMKASISKRRGSVGPLFDKNALQRMRNFTSLTSLSININKDARDLILTPNLARQIVKSCPRLASIVLNGLVEVTKAPKDSDIFTPLAKLKTLTEVSIESCAEAFYEVPVCHALSQWGRLKKFHLAQFQVSNFKYFHYEFLNPAAIINSLADFHSETLEALTLSFPKIFGPSTMIGHKALKKLATSCLNLKELRLDQEYWYESDLLNLKPLVNIEKFSMQILAPYYQFIVKKFLYNDDGSLTFPKMKNCEIGIIMRPGGADDQGEIVMTRSDINDFKDKLVRGLKESYAAIGKNYNVTFPHDEESLLKICCV